MLAAKIVQLGLHLATLRGQEGVSKWVYVRPWSGMVKKVRNQKYGPKTLEPAKVAGKVRVQKVYALGL